MIMRVKKGSDPMDEVAKFLSTNQGMEVFQLLESLVSEI
jgi:hypothetical protein